MKFGITGNFNKPEFFKISGKIYEKLTEHGHEFILSERIIQQDKEFLKYNVTVAPLELLADELDVVLSIGGDGTILSTARTFGDAGIPILGIHIGRLGFLTECTRHDYLQALDDIFAGDYSITERMLLKVVIKNGKKQTLSHALNDVVIEHGVARILKIHVHVSEEFLNTYESDGMIFATPTGSTAYSLSAGGPIITPDLDVITVTPICPHSLAARPIVIPPDKTISISFEEDQAGMSLTVDGQIQVPVDYSSKITLTRAGHRVKMISFPQRNYFFQTLRKKLAWSGNIH